MLFKLRSWIQMRSNVCRNKSSVRSLLPPKPLQNQQHKEATKHVLRAEDRSCLVPPKGDLCVRWLLLKLLLLPPEQVFASNRNRQVLCNWKARNPEQKPQLKGTSKKKNSSRRSKLLFVWGWSPQMEELFNFMNLQEEGTGENYGKK